MILINPVLERQILYVLFQLWLLEFTFTHTYMIQEWLCCFAHNCAHVFLYSIVPYTRIVCNGFFKVSFHSIRWSRTVMVVQLNKYINCHWTKLHVLKRWMWFSIWMISALLREKNWKLILYNFLIWNLTQQHHSQHVPTSA